MNVLWLHEDPETATQHHADMHVPKMGIEAMQCVSDGMRANGADADWMTEAYMLDDENNPSHALTEWVAESKAHADAVLRLGRAVMYERERRWPDRNDHATWERYEQADTSIADWPNTEWVRNPPQFGVPDELVDDNYVVGYRRYMLERRDYHDATWTDPARQPAWAERAKPSIVTV